MNGITRDDPRFGDDEIIEMARKVEPHDFDRIAPPPQVWNNVLAELEVAIASEEANARRQSRTWFTPAQMMATAAAMLLMVGLAAVVISSFRSVDEPGREIAAAVLTDEGLPVATSETATARVVCLGDICNVEVDLSALPDAGAADLELWVINSDVSDMHSLGPVTVSDGLYRLPDNVSPEDFPIVDISIEPRDGEPAHSGQSVLRGVFNQT